MSLRFRNTSYIELYTKFMASVANNTSSSYNERRPLQISLPTPKAIRKSSLVNNNAQINSYNHGIDSNCSPASNKANNVLFKDKIKTFQEDVHIISPAQQIISSTIGALATTIIGTPLDLVNIRSSDCKISPSEMLHIESLLCQSLLPSNKLGKKIYSYLDQGRRRS